MSALAPNKSTWSFSILVKTLTRSLLADGGGLAGRLLAFGAPPGGGGGGGGGPPKPGIGGGGGGGGADILILILDHGQSV